MLDALREEVYEANLELVRRNLVISTFGNASGISREEGLVAIKPSGLPYDAMTPADLVIVDLHGKPVEGTLRPSSDLGTHLVLYRAFPQIGGVVHTHSPTATAWAQAGKPIPCFGTTHADYFRGPVPVTEPMTSSEIAEAYEENTGHVIVRTFDGSLDPSEMPAVLVAGHAPFCWGETATEAAHHAVMLEELARMAFQTLAINPEVRCISNELLDKHYRRKHGGSAYYGQR